MRAHIIRRMMDNLAARDVQLPPEYREKLGVSVEALPWHDIAPLAAEIAAEAEAAKYKPLMLRKKEGM